MLDTLHESRDLAALVPDESDNTRLDIETFEHFGGRWSLVLRQPDCQPGACRLTSTCSRDDAIVTGSMRIAALSDLHGYLPTVPQCDLLIVAGDVCVDQIGKSHAAVAHDQQERWFDRYVRPWFGKAPAVHKVMTWGNHDWCGEDGDFGDDMPGRAKSEALQIVVDGENVRAVRWIEPFAPYLGDALVECVHGLGVHEEARRVG